MAATVMVGFDPKPRRLGDVRTYIAGETILKGQIVAFADTGVTRTVHPATTSLGSPVGVALQGAATGERVTVAGNGSELKIELSADNGTDDAGDWMAVSSVAGAAIVHPGDIEAHEGEAAGYFTIGQAQEDISAGASTVGGKGYIKINIGPIWTLDA